MPNPVLKFAAAHKIGTALALLLVVSGGAYAYRASKSGATETRYVLGAVEKGTIVSSVSGSGQVSTSDQVDLKPKVAGDILRDALKAGTKVKAGQLLVSIDATDALKAVSDAQDSLVSAQLSLEKLKQAADSLTLLQSQNSLTAAQESKARAESDLEKDYEDGFNAVSNIYLELPDIMSGLDDLLFSSSLNHSQSNIDAYADGARRYDKTVNVYEADARSKYATARAAFDAGFDAYKLSSRSASRTEIEAMIDDTSTVVRDASDAIKAATNLIQFYVDQLTMHGSTIGSLTTSHLNTLSGYTSKTNAEISSALAAARTIADGKNAIVSAERAIAEREGSLAKLQEPPDALDLRTAELNVHSRETALADARAKLADYSVRAPFDGTVAAVANLKRGDSVSTGTSLGTLITDQPIAELSLNEIDAAKVKVGQKATLTFDVIEGLSITGQVIELDTLGTVSQGVVNYGMKIAFDTDDERIKPGMTVSAAIITEAKTDVLMVPSSAVKGSGDAAYVEVIDGAAAADAQEIGGILAPQGTRRASVVAGTSNDTETEIVSGLNEGDLIVVRTLTSAATGAASTQNRSILQAAGAGARAGGGFRAGGNATFIGR